MLYFSNESKLGIDPSKKNKSLIPKKERLYGLGYMYPARLFCSEAARKATQTFLTRLAPMLELLPIN